MRQSPLLARFSADRVRWLGRLHGLGAEALLDLWSREILPRCREVEEVLLPALANRLSEADAPIVFTLQDHVALRGLDRKLREAAGPAAAARLAGKLEEHLAFEVRTLFPAIQQVLGCDALRLLEKELTSSRPTHHTKRNKP